ncbi:MAG: L-histidine N(alpha)-methyltransferase [Hyphomicrobiales bacterium]|nr:L-histidine N(alpha)-methyltransferase [Hyphomicrobiales bacterium]
MTLIDEERNAALAVSGDDAARAAFLEHVREGLSKPQKTLSPKYLYDAKGSELFERITDLDEYYPTRTEIGILEAHVADMAAMIGPKAELIELGSGASVKTRILLDALPSLDRYVPVDISGDHMEAAAEALRADYPALTVAPVEADFSKSFMIERPKGTGKRVLFFPGSTIGNFEAGGAHEFLTRMGRDLAPDLVIIGADLKKDRATLIAAYDDEAGVTAAFNMNLLTRVNRELGAGFDLSAFRHEARWNEAFDRIEMHLVSLQDQTVTIGDGLDGASPFTIRFAQGETIHTENSHKYTFDCMNDLARDSGWRPETVWTDENGLFSVHVWALAA